MLSETSSISRCYSEGLTNNDIIPGIYRNSSDDIATKIRQNILETIPATPEWFTHGIGEFLDGVCIDVNNSSVVESADVTNNQKKSNETNEYNSLKNIQPYGENQYFGIDIDSCDLFEISYSKPKINYMCDLAHNFQTSEDTDIYAETARLSMRFSSESLDFGDVFDSKYTKYDYGVTEQIPSSLGDQTISPTIAVGGSNDSVFLSPKLANDSHGQPNNQTCISQIQILKQNSRNDQQHVSKGRQSNNKDVEKRESHNNMEKMRRRVVAHAFDMVVKSIGHESSRKPSKVTILAMAYEYCNKYCIGREPTSKRLAHLSSSRNELKKKITSFIAL